MQKAVIFHYLLPVWHCKLYFTLISMEKVHEIQKCLQVVTLNSKFRLCDLRVM